MELVLEFDRDQCEASDIWLTLRYEGIGHLQMDFSRSIHVDLSSPDLKTKRLFFPSFSQNGLLLNSEKLYRVKDRSYFSGIEMSKKQSKCLSGVYRVKNLRSLPILLTVQLPLNGEHLYKQLMWRGGSTTFTVPSKMSQDKIDRMLTSPLLPIGKEDIDYLDPISHFYPDEQGGLTNKIIINGYPKIYSHIDSYFTWPGKNWRIGKIVLVDKQAPLLSADLMLTKPKWYKKGSTFVAKGTLYNGGVMFALLNGNLPSGRAIVTNPGNFDVIFEVPHDGMYTVGVANYLGTYNALENRLQAKIGWVEK